MGMAISGARKNLYERNGMQSLTGVRSCENIVFAVPSLDQNRRIGFGDVWVLLYSVRAF